LLGDKLALLDALSSPQDKTCVLQAPLAAAGAQCHAWAALAPDQLRALLRTLIIKVTIASNTIAMVLSKAALRAWLLTGTGHCVADSAAPAHRGFEDDVIELTLEARPRRCGREVRLMVTPDEGSSARSREDPQLLKALAQGRLWLDQLLRGEARSLRSLAKSARLSERYVSQVVHCAFLAPDLVEAVLQGRQPVQLTLTQMKALPLDWNEQHRPFWLCLQCTAQYCCSTGTVIRLPQQQRCPWPLWLGALRPANRMEVRIQLTPPSSPVRTIVISCSTPDAVPKHSHTVVSRAC
jgi:hypothetical protein